MYKKQTEGKKQLKVATVVSQYMFVHNRLGHNRLRGRSLKLKKRPRLDLRKFTFSQRVVRMWNDLPADIGTAPTAKVFKKLLEAHFERHPGWPPE